MEIKDMRIDQVVVFGRARGEKTLARVTSIGNRGYVHVTQLEARGTHRVGTDWRVPATGCVPATAEQIARVAKAKVDTTPLPPYMAGVPTLPPYTNGDDVLRLIVAMSRAGYPTALQAALSKAHGL